jgi:uncharacterized membrane protein YdfJ with MMPL/SSD domain
MLGLAYYVIISEVFAPALASEIGFAINTDMAVLYVTHHRPDEQKRAWDMHARQLCIAVVGGRRLEGG